MTFIEWLILAVILVVGLAISAGEAKKPTPDKGTGLVAMGLSSLIAIVIIWAIYYIVKG